MNKFSLPELSRNKRKTLLDDAMQLLDAQSQMMRGDKNILHYTLRRRRKFVGWHHYPKGDRIDYKSGNQYYYHCHRENMHTEEHGHFHCFTRYKAIPKRIKPAALPDWDKYIDRPMTHLVAIAMNRLGQPIRLFTVNRWVTEETWYDAKHIDYFTKKFALDIEGDDYWKLLDQWIEGMMHVFAPQIIWLQHQRDAAIAKFQKKNPGKNVFTDKSIEELSQIKISLQKQIEWLAT